MKLKMILITLLASQQVFAGVTVSSRCSTEGDSLGGPAAKGRAAWTLKCYPESKFQADADGLFYLKDATSGTKHLGYPTFVKVNAAGDAVNWTAPTDPKAGCVDKTTHFLRGFCLAGCYTPDQMVLFSDGYQEILTPKMTREWILFLFQKIQHLKVLTLKSVNSLHTLLMKKP